MLKDVEINISIIGKDPENAFWDYDLDTEQLSLYLGFTTFKDYLDYLNGNKSIKIDELFTKDEVDPSILDIPSLENCSQELRDILSKQTVTIVVEKLEELDFDNLPPNPLTINTIALSFEEIIELLKNPRLNPHTKFIDKYNGNTMLSLEEMQFAYTYYEYLKVISADMSQSEKTYLVYDLVRGQEYAAEREDQDNSVSRDLNQTLNNDKIVCLGFANQMAAACNFLGINAEVQYWKSANEDDPGHANIVVYLDDDKYGIKGTFVFDPTSDCKKHSSDREYLNSCSTAFVPYKLYIYMAGKGGMLEDKNSTISYLASALNRLEFFKKMHVNSIIVKNETGLIEKRLQKLDKFFNKVESFQDRDSLEALEEAAKAYLSYSKVVTREALKEILKVVRTAECSLDADYYAFSDKDLDTLYRSSITAKAYQREEDKARELLGRILGSSDE